MWDWLQRRKEDWSLSKSFRFSWTGAEKDKCLRCAVERRYHEKSFHHAFVEKEES